MPTSPPNGFAPQNGVATHGGFWGDRAATKATEATEATEGAPPAPVLPGDRALAAHPPTPPAGPVRSARRRAANQANAALSTGPRTPAGKARVAQNAAAHGLYTPAMVIRYGPLAEDAAEADGFAEAVRADLRPVGAVENALADRVASLLWRLRRATRADAALAEVSTLRRDHFGDVIAGPAPMMLLDAGEEPRPDTPLVYDADGIGYQRARPHVYAAEAAGAEAVQRGEAHLSRELARTLALLGALHGRRAAP